MISYLISLTHRAFYAKAYGMIGIILVLMLFYSVFYSVFIYREKIDSKVGVAVGFVELFIKIFIVFHSSVFAVAMSVGFSNFGFNPIIVYFYVGFIINAINLDIIGRFNGSRRVSEWEK